MSEKNSKETNVSIVLVLILIIIIGIVLFIIYNQYTKNLEESNVVGTENTVSSVNNESTTNTEVEYIVVKIEDETSTEGLTYKEKKITDKEKIDEIMEVVNSAEEYEEKDFIADIGDIPPVVEIYLNNGEKYTISAGDGIRDGEESVNLMMKWYKKDESDKTLYKVDTELGKYIEDLFNN